MRIRKVWLIIFCVAYILIPVLSESKKNTRNYVILKKGETLWRISKRYNIPLKELCRINNIKDVTKIKAGTKIYLRKKIRKPLKLNISLQMPVKGRVIKHFGTGKSIIQLNGIEIKGKRWAKVRASADGIVKFTGPLRGYGKVIIIQHTSDISMVYAYLDKIYVKLNQKVRKGEVIGRLGKDYLNRNNVLHFELLKNGQPIDPLKYFRL